MHVPEDLSLFVRAECLDQAEDSGRAERRGELAPFGAFRPECRDISIRYAAHETNSLDKAVEKLIILIGGREAEYSR